MDAKALAALKAAATLVLLAAALFAWLRWFERLNLYHPDRELTILPSNLGLPFEEAFIETSDGVRLHAWFIPPRGPSPVMLVCHGNAGNISYRVDRAAAYAKAGLGTLLFDWRGYGRSEGRPTEEGMGLDALAAYDWLVRRGVRSSAIVPFGESLGGSVALELALQRQVGAVALEGVPTSTVDVGAEVFPFLPVRLAKYRYDALGRISRLERPVLIAHSPDDEIIRFRHAERLYNAAREPKELIRLPGGHNDAFETGGEAYLRALSAFVRRHARL